MSIIRLCFIALSLGSICVLGSMPSLVASTTRSSPNAEQVLYDGSQGGLPAEQGHLTYGTNDAQATQSFSNGATTLDTTANNSIAAGYGYIGNSFDRTTGYTVRFTVQVASEDHANNDRAGFSIIALSSDHQGIELGFWTDQIWAQNYDNTNQFTHGETAPFSTTAALTTYDLTIFGDTYTLRSGGNDLLTGSLRDYSSFCSTPGAPRPCPYAIPNALFLGDDTTSAQAKILFSFASLTLGTPEIPTPTTTISPSATAMPSATPTPQSTRLFLPALMKAP